MMHEPNLNQLWASLIVEEVIRCGVRTFVIAPGSRSAPLAVAAFRNPKARAVVHYDERGASYYALGASRAGDAAAVICTSGTAVANCFPAVAEANLSALPLVILSADRPPELQDCGANQTMRQAGLFGDHAHASLSLSCPDLAISASALLMRLDSVLSRCCSTVPGPVHINCPFREPLAPVPIPGAWPPEYLEGLRDWECGNAPFTPLESNLASPSSEELGEVAESLKRAKQGLILLGRMHWKAEQDAALSLARCLGWPVFADILSGCRRDDPRACILPYYDVLLHSPAFRKCVAPDTVLHMGDVFVSKRLQEHLAQLRPSCYIHLHPRQDSRDPLHLVTRHVRGDIGGAGALLEALLAPPETVSTPVLNDKALPAVVDDCVAELFEEGKPVTELAVARIIKNALPKGYALFLGNSMPVRCMDMMGDDWKAGLVHANRGVSGIDGSIATASGLARPDGKGVVAVLGDMAVLHDLSSLALLATSPVPVILVIVNNGGGGIFSFLPIADFPDVLEPCFIHPHHREFSGAAALFGIEYSRAARVGEFTGLFRQALDSGKSGIIEVVVDRKENVRAHRAFLDEVARRLEQASSGGS